MENYLLDSASYVNEASWNKRFDIPLAVFLEMSVDPNLKLFMGMETRGDMLNQKTATPKGEAEMATQDRRPLYSPIADPEKFPA